VTRNLLLFFPALFIFSILRAQTVPDSLARDSVRIKAEAPVQDTVTQVLVPKIRITKDTTHKSNPQRKTIASIAKDSSILPETLRVSTANPEISRAPEILVPSQFMKTLSANPDFDFMGRGEGEAMEIHNPVSYDSIFYLLIGILFYFALFKVLFGKYLGNLFTLFFLVSMRRQQIREQVLQSPLPSLLLNILFVITGGLYISFLIRYFQFAQGTDFWLLLFDSIAVLSLVYLCKFLFLKFSGWIFKISRATDTYIFIIFLTNKVLGIFLLPFLLIISFSGPMFKEASLTASLIMIAFLFIYRFSVSFSPIRKEIKVSGFHFLLYLCAFELAPLLLIYKVLLSYLEKSN